MSDIWLYGPVPPSHPTAVKRVHILDQTISIIETLSSYPAILGSRQTGKTSLIYQLMEWYSHRFTFVFLDFQSWGDVEPRALYARTLRQIASAAPSTSEWILNSSPQNGPDFQEIVRKVAAECQKDRLVFLCDELGGLQHEVALQFSNVARSIFTERSQIKEYSKVSFVFAGGLDLDRLTGASSPLNNIVSHLYLEDLDLDAVRKMASSCALGHHSDEIYDWTNGHPYLTQRILSGLASAASSPTPDDVVDTIIQEGDSNISNLLKRVRSSSETVRMVAQQVLAGQEIPFSRITPQIAELELIGLLTADNNGKCMIRNNIYRRALETNTQSGQIDIGVQLLTDTIPTGYCQNLTAKEFPLVEVTISNQTEAPADICASAVIPNYSSPWDITIKAQPQSQESVALLPILLSDKTKNLTRLSPVGMQVTVKRLDTGVHLYDETHRVLLHAKDTALIALVDPMTLKLVADLTSYLSAWVTPQAQGIEEILAMAADRHPDQNLVGYQGNGTLAERAQIVRKQAQAIYETLQRNVDITYINAPLNLGAQGDQIMQRVRLPARTLEIASANCIDGTVLFASLLECICINPVLVIVPSHAYVGWEVWPGSSKYEYLETTLLKNHSFSEAQEAARIQTEKAWSNNDQTRPLLHPGGFWLQIDVGKCRQQGILPIE